MASVYHLVARRPGSSPFDFARWESLSCGIRNRGSFESLWLCRTTLCTMAGTSGFRDMRLWGRVYVAGEGIYERRTFACESCSGIRISRAFAETTEVEISPFTAELFCRTTWKSDVFPKHQSLRLYIFSSRFSLLPSPIPPLGRLRTAGRRALIRLLVSIGIQSVG